MKKRFCRFAAGVFALFLLTSCCAPEMPTGEEPKTKTENKTEAETENKTETETQDKSQTEAVGNSASNDTFPTFSDIPDYVGEPYAVLHDNIPYFSEEALRSVSFESYSPRDTLGRCGTAYACLSTELMPTEKRGSIGSIKPSGWQTVKYDIVDGGYLYNRCHLIGFQLTGENANADNLITGTRYMNVEGMLPFENMTADYIKETENHVLYRATPLYNGDELVARGVVMEAMSTEDEGEDLSFCVFCYNVQPGITIDYATGESALSENTTYDHPSEIERQDEPTFDTYVLNTNTKKIHRPSCSSVADIAEENREDFTGDIGEKIKDGYALCKKCKPS